MLTDGIIAARHRRANLVTAFLGQVDDGLRVAETTFYPFLDLAIRLWLAQLFWVSGLLKLADWDNALRLATYEYPVAWLDPATAAALGIAIEVICPVLLAILARSFNWGCGCGWRRCGLEDIRHKRCLSHKVW